LCDIDSQSAPNVVKSGVKVNIFTRGPHFSKIGTSQFEIPS
jgi:hypothetical protein